MLELEGDTGDLPNADELRSSVAGSSTGVSATRPSWGQRVWLLLRSALAFGQVPLQIVGSGPFTAPWTFAIGW